MADDPAFLRKYLEEPIPSWARPKPRPPGREHLGPGLPVWSVQPSPSLESLSQSLSESARHDIPLWEGPGGEPHPMSALFRKTREAALAKDLPGIVRPGHDYFLHVSAGKGEQLASIEKHGLFFGTVPGGENPIDFMSGPWNRRRGTLHGTQPGLPGTIPAMASYHGRGERSRAYIIEVPKGISSLDEVSLPVEGAAAKAREANLGSRYFVQDNTWSRRIDPKYIVGYVEAGKFSPLPATAERVGKQVLKSPTLMSRLSGAAGAASGAIAKDAKIFARNMPAATAGALFYDLLPPIGGTPFGTAFLSATTPKAGEGSDLADERAAARQEKSREEEYWRTHTPDVQQMSLPERVRYEEFQERDALAGRPSLYEQSFAGDDDFLLQEGMMVPKRRE